MLRAPDAPGRARHRRACGRPRQVLPARGQVRPAARSWDRRRRRSVGGRHPRDQLQDPALTERPHGEVTYGLSDLSEALQGLAEGNPPKAAQHSMLAHGLEHLFLAGILPEVIDDAYCASCQTANDCIGISAGLLCPDTCACGGAAVNRMEQLRYDNTVWLVGASLACPCVVDGLCRTLADCPSIWERSEPPRESKPTDCRVDPHLPAGVRSCIYRPRR